MTNQYYESHITIVGVPDEVRSYVERLGWKFSAIDGDPVLGKGVKCYATRQFKGTLNPNTVLLNLTASADRIHELGFNVVRRKIELVIYDDRSSKISFECSGGCPECHTEDLTG